MAGGRWKVAEAWKVAQEVGGGSMLAGRDSGWSGSMKSRYMRQPQKLAKVARGVGRGSMNR